MAISLSDFIDENTTLHINYYLSIILQHTETISISYKS